MWTLLLATFLIACGSSGTSRRGDVISKLQNLDRQKEALEKCNKWQAARTESDSNLKESCAKVFLVDAKTKDTGEDWKSFREKWKGTQTAELSRDPHAKALLRELEQKGSEEDYLSISNLALSQEIKDIAMKAAISAAIQSASDTNAASEVMQRYQNSDLIMGLVDRFPLAFFKLNLNGKKVSFEKIGDHDLPTPKYKWTARWPDGATRDWDTTVRASLEAMGIPRSHIMKHVQAHQGDGPALPLCPLNNQPPGFVAGISLMFKGKSVFEPIAWDKECDAAWPTLLSYRNKKFSALSLGPGHYVFMRLKKNLAKNQRRDITDFIRPKTTPFLDGDKIYRPYKSSFIIYPLTGSPPYISDQPPGVWKLPLNNKLLGSPLPESWIQTKQRSAVVLQTNKDKTWRMPPGEIRSFSPTIRLLLGISQIIPQQHDKIEIPWIESKRGRIAPAGSKSLALKRMKSRELTNAGRQLAASGFDMNQIEIHDGWAIDINGDGLEEAVLRTHTNKIEAVYILDRDLDKNSRTFVFETKHAKHGKRPAPTPFAFSMGDLVVVAWSGTEDKVQYTEWITTDRDGYILHGM